MGNKHSTVSVASSGSGSQNSPDNKPGRDKSIKASESSTGPNKISAKKVLKSWAPPMGEGVPGEATRLAKAWVQAKNERNMMKLLQLAHPDACYRLPAESICIPMRDFIETIFALCDSFPDLEYKYADAAEPRQGSAVLYEYYATGSHTGTSYSFQGLPDIPPNHVKVLDGPVVKTITVKDGKIIDFLVYAPLGNRVGPLAFYEASKIKHRELKALTQI